MTTKDKIIPKVWYQYKVHTKFEADNNQLWNKVSDKVLWKVLSQVYYGIGFNKTLSVIKKEIFLVEI